MKNHDEEAFNREIGIRVRNRRKVIGFNGPQFSRMLGISPQQLYKYENGQDRISAIKLCYISRLLNAEISYFLKVDPALIVASSKPSKALDNDHYISSEILEDKETQALLRHYVSLGDTRTRLAFVDLVKSVSKYCIKINARTPVRRV